MAARAACDVTRTYYDGLGRVYAVVQRLTGQSITDPNVPTSGLTNESNLRYFTLYDAAGQAIASIPADPGCAASHASDGSWTIGASCVINRTYYDGLGRVVTVVRNLTGQSYTDPVPPQREARQTSFPYYEHPDQNVRTDTRYDASGNAIEQVDAAGVVTHFGYDGQGRLTDVYEHYRPGFNPTESINVHTVVRLRCAR